MRNRQQKELQRLEKALMEMEDTEESFEEEVADWQQSEDLDYDVYNTDDTDVDLDAYSEDVHEGSSGGGLGVLLTMILMVGLSVCILILLKLLGVL